MPHHPRVITTAPSRGWLPHPAATIRPRVPAWCDVRGEAPFRTLRLAQTAAALAGVLGTHRTPARCDCGGYHLDNQENR